MRLPTLVAAAVVLFSAAAAPAGAQVCAVIAPVAEPAPPAPEIDQPWAQPYPAPELDPSVARLLDESSAAAAAGDDALAARKLTEAVDLLGRGLPGELQRLHRDGLAAAARGGPRAPRQLSDILHHGQQAEQLGVPSDAVRLAGDVLSGYANVRFDQLRASGLEVAAAGQPHPPAEVGEIIALEQQLSTLVGPGRGMQVMQEVLSHWATARLTILDQEADEATGAGSENIPRQFAEALEIARIASVGLDDEAVLDQAMTLARSILERWSVERATTLGAPGVDAAARADPLPPDEAARLRGIAVELAKLDVQATQASEAARDILSAWIDAHVERLSPPGRAAASAGGPSMPEQVQELMDLADDLDCLGDELGAHIADVRTEARAVGELHLGAFRERLDCPATDAQLASLDGIVSRLEGFGWGPYDRTGPRCGWRGTVTSRWDHTLQRDTRDNSQGQPLETKWDSHSWYEYRWEVDGDVAQVSLTGGGGGVEHMRILAPSCGLQDSRTEKTFSVSGARNTVPFNVRRTSGETYVIESLVPARTEVTTVHLKTADSQACPLKGVERTTTETVEMEETDLLLQDTAVLIESLTGGAPGRMLKGEIRSNVLNDEYRKVVLVISWELHRER